MKTKEEIELAFRTDKENWPGYNGRLEFRPLQFEDSRLLLPVLKRDKGTISSYLHKFNNSKKWNLHDAQALVSFLVVAPWPNFTYLFHINNHPIGIMSICPFGEIDECQLVLAVFKEHQGKGFAKAMTATILAITEQVWGFRNTWWIADSQNRASLAVAKQAGFLFDSSYDSVGKHEPSSSSGFYFRLVKARPEGLPPGVLQGASEDYWKVPKDAKLLEVVLDARAKLDGQED